MYTEDQIAAVKGVRPRGNGKFECVVNHPSLPRHGMSKVFDTDRAARIWKLDQLQVLAGRPATQTESDAPEIILHAKRPTNLHDILEAFASKAPNLSRTMKLQAKYLRSEPALSVDYTKITPVWASKLVEGYKTGPSRITPQSIRKKIDCIRIALDWFHQAYWAQAGMTIPVNHLDKLPRKYHDYESTDPNAKLNRRRQRRLNPGEEQAIEDVIMGRKRRACNRPVRFQAETMMLVRLLINSGLRLREAYTLRSVDVDMTRALITVRRSKMSYKGEATGARTVPVMHAQLYHWLKEYMEVKGITAGTKQPLFACWWSGQELADELAPITSTLSQTLKSLFEDAGCENLVAHDTRHEGVSRWCELKNKDGGRRFGMQDVMRFTGHGSIATFNSYVHFFMTDFVPEDVQAMLD